MIAFDLKCENGHSFEGWFQDGGAFEEQKNKGLISCPICENTNITKAISTFAIKKSGATPKSHLINKKIDPQIALKDLNKKIVDFVEKNFDDVGTDFTKEALKIHCGVTEPRNIRGVSTKEEEKILKDEGVEFFKMPPPLENDDKDFDA